MTEQEFQNKIQELESKIQKLEANYAKHQHDGLDGTNQLRKSIKLDVDQWMQVGLGSQATAPQDYSKQGQDDEQLQYSIGVGKDDGRTGFVSKANILQMDFLHQPQTLLSFLTARRTPVVSSSLEGTTVSTTAGGNTVTIPGYNFATNELAGAVIGIYTEAGGFIESKIIASNTATVVTITGTWLATSNPASFEIYRPVYMGAADYIYQRFYAQEGTAGGIRFGIGPTNEGQNGLIYMDSAGALFWRNKAGASTKIFLNASTPLSGTKTYYVSDSSGGAVDRKLTFINGILTSES